MQDPPRDASCAMIAERKAERIMREECILNIGCWNEADAILIDNRNDSRKKKRFKNQGKQGNNLGNKR